MRIAPYDVYRQTHIAKAIPSKTHSKCGFCNRVIFAHIVHDKETCDIITFCPDCGEVIEHVPGENEQG